MDEGFPRPLTEKAKEKTNRYFRVNITSMGSEYIVAENKKDAIRKVSLLDFYRGKEGLEFKVVEMDKIHFDDEQDKIRQAAEFANRD